MVYIEADVIREMGLDPETFDHCTSCHDDCDEYGIDMCTILDFKGEQDVEVCCAVHIEWEKRKMDGGDVDHVIDKREPEECWFCGAEIDEATCQKEPVLGHDMADCGPGFPKSEEPMPTCYLCWCSSTVLSWRAFYGGESTLGEPSVELLQQVAFVKELNFVGNTILQTISKGE